VTTSSTWTFESDLPLRGVGIDVEEVGRFLRLDAAGGLPLRHVFSPAETAHAQGQRVPARALCAAFCCKEALLKALGEPYEYRDCEMLFDEAAKEQDLCLASELRAEQGVGAARALVRFTDSGECVAVVHAFVERR